MQFGHDFIPLKAFCLGAHPRFLLRSEFVIGRILHCLDAKSVFFSVVLLWQVLWIHPLWAAGQNDKVLSLLAEMESSYAGITDYVTVFHKQERIDGKLLPEETILLKFQKPLKVYMKWIENPHRGREVIYVQGKYDDKLVGHQGGVMGFLALSLDPRGALAMRGNRHPVTEVGFGHLIEGMLENVRKAMKLGDFRLIEMDEKPFKGRPAIAIEADFDSRGARRYYATRIICHVDRKLLLPIAVSFYDDEDRLVEKYDYTDVRVNVGLNDADFSKENPEYQF